MSDNDKRDDDDLELELDLEDLELDLDDGPDEGADDVDEAEINQLLSEDAGEVEEDVDELDLDLDLDLADEDLSEDALADDDLLDDREPLTSGVAAASDEAPASQPLSADAPVLAGAAVPATTGQPAATEGAAADAEVVSAEAEGQWVWQFSAPPPPPPFSAVYFSGTALKELYSFFFCGILVALGCLLPWAYTDPTNPDAGSVLVPGFTLVGGMISLPIALYLILGAGQGIYSRRQKIMPVVLMLVPAEIAVMRLVGAWGAMPDEVASLGMADMLSAWLHAAGTGVVLTAVGSIAVSLRFVMALGKIVGTKDPKKEARKEKAGKGARAAGKAKPEKPAKAKKEKPAKGKAKREKPTRGKKSDDAAEAGGGARRGRRGRKR